MVLSRRCLQPRSKLFLALAAFALLPTAASATWSIIAVDARTGRVVIASATCVPQASLLNFPSKGLMDVQAIVVPGIARFRLLHPQVRTSRAMPPFVWF